MNKILRKIPILKFFLRKYDYIQNYCNNLEKIIKRDYAKRIYNLLLVKDVDNAGYVRVGGMHDGGYVMLNNFDNVRIAYSCGVAEEISWDEDMASREIDVYMYDYSVNRIPSRNPRLHFFRRGIDGETNRHKNMYSLEDLIEENGHRNERHMILKMDIEGYEWNVLENITLDTLDRFDQIVLELHNILDVPEVYSEPLLEKLNKSHQVVHIHGNAVGRVFRIDEKHVIPSYLEVTYVKRNLGYSFMESKRSFPTTLDCSNQAGVLDCDLGEWNQEI